MALHGSFVAAPIAIRITLASVIGCICGFVYFISPKDLSAVRAFAHNPGLASANAGQFVGAFVLYTFFGFLMVLPLVAVAITFGVLCRQKIAKNPFTWSMFAAVATWMTASALLEFTGTPNLWAQAHSAAERFRYILLSSDGMLLLAGSLGAGLSFYLLEIAHQRTVQRTYLSQK